ncbi:MAG TPA: FliA/WhiG family RNA polymerase sigma factor [Bacillota bacterium]|nr:FliA/WhiG family RNA polymerase sigma factor [Clostridiales bacterium]HPT85455.1 FliA/WhiG family RNA polymerase sigma factor [Bacillota bacterium]
MTANKAGGQVIDEGVWKEYARTRDINLRNKILDAYLYIVSVNIKRMNLVSLYKQDIEDITNHGILELIKCIERYDYTRGIQFDTYASIRVRGSILDYIRKKDWVPADVRKRVREMNECIARFRAEHRRNPRDDELAEAMGVSADELSEIRKSELNMNLLNFEELIYKAESQGMVDSSRSDTGRPEEKTLADELKRIIAQSVDELDQNERTVISLYYYEGLKFKEIAFVMDVTPSRITQIHMKALRKLKEKISRYLTI